MHDDPNLKVNELLYRRVHLDDVVNARRLALTHAPALGFGRYIISATTPFTPDDLPALRADAPRVVRRLFPDYENVYAQRDWTNAPEHRAGIRERSRAQCPGLVASRRLPSLPRPPRRRRRSPEPLAVAVGAKGYHREATTRVAQPRPAFSPRKRSQFSPARLANVRLDVDPRRPSWAASQAATRRW